MKSPFLTRTWSDVFRCHSRASTAARIARSIRSNDTWPRLISGRPRCSCWLRRPSSSTPEQANPDPQIVERLKNLARPHLGQWWELARLLGAGAGHTRRRAVWPARRMALGPNPRRLAPSGRTRCGPAGNAGQEKEGQPGGRPAARFVRSSGDLSQQGHRPRGSRSIGRLSQPKDVPDAAWRGGPDAGLASIFWPADGCCTSPTCGKSRETGRSSDFELLGEKARRLEPLQLPRSAAARLPDGKSVALEMPGSAPAVERLRSLHPLIMYEPQSEQVLFLCGRPGERKTDYLCYTTGLHTERPDLGGEPRELLARVLKMPVDGASVSEAAENPAEDVPSIRPNQVPSRGSALSASFNSSRSSVRGEWALSTVPGNRRCGGRWPSKCSPEWGKGRGPLQSRNSSAGSRRSSARRESFHLGLRRRSVVLRHGTRRGGAAVDDLRTARNAKAGCHGGRPANLARRVEHGLCRSLVCVKRR